MRNGTQKMKQHSPMLGDECTCDQQKQWGMSVVGRRLWHERKGRLREESRLTEDSEDILHPKFHFEAFPVCKSGILLAL
jgi:hypothetical protein